MTRLNKLENRSTIGNVDVVILRLAKSIRLIAGLGINVIGGGVLLAHSVRFLGWSI